MKLTKREVAIVKAALGFAIGSEQEFADAQCTGWVKDSKALNGWSQTGVHRSNREAFNKANRNIAAFHLRIRTRELAKLISVVEATEWGERRFAYDAFSVFRVAGEEP